MFQLIYLNFFEKNLKNIFNLLNFKQKRKKNNEDMF